MLFAGQHIAKSPFEVYVDKSQGDASKVTAQGPGLEPSGNIANKTTYFEIFTAGERRLPSKRFWGGGVLLGSGRSLEALGAKLVLCGRSWLRGCRGHDPGPYRTEGHCGASAGGQG